MRLPSRASAVLASLASLVLASGLVAATGPGASASGPGASAGGTGVTRTADLNALQAASLQATAAARKARKKKSNPPTPGAFTGYGFDQCLAPTQAAMDAWLEHSPFMAVGIYISGDSRGCRHQPNLTPGWISTQLSKGWRLLPIALGPQASCHPKFPRYGNDPTINPNPGPNKRYRQARLQGKAEAEKNAAAARKLGLSPGSTLFYDLEGFDHRNTHCRESALAFTSAWTNRIERLGYVSGFYSSASSGIVMLDEARTKRPGVKLPQQIWIARWDGVPNTSTTYIGEAGWRPGGRLKQYRGDHYETWGGVRIQIDSNWLELGAAPRAAREDRCGGVRTSFGRYWPLKVKKYNRPRTKTLQCLLTETGHYTGPVHGTYNIRTRRAAKAWSASVGLPEQNRFTKRHWVALHAQGERPLLKVGSTGPAVRRVQRSLNAAKGTAKLTVSGVYDQATERAMKSYQGRQRITTSGATNTATWAALQAGRP